MASASDLQCFTDFQLCPENYELNIILKKIDQRNSDAKNKMFIDQILGGYSESHKSPEENYARNVLIEAFAILLSKKNLRKYMYEKLNTMKIEEKTLFEYIIDDVTREIEENINKAKIFNFTQCNQICVFLGSYIQNFEDDSKREFVFEKTFQFYLCVLEVYTSQLDNSSFFKDGVVGKSILQFGSCQSVLLTILNQFSKTIPLKIKDNLKERSTEIVIMMHKIMEFHNELKLELLNKSALIFARFLMLLPDEEKIFLKWKTTPILEFIDDVPNKYCLKLKSKTLHNLFYTDRMKVVLILAMYHTMHRRSTLEVQVRGTSLMEYLYFAMIRLAKKMTTTPELIAKMSKALSDMAHQVPRFQNYSDIFELSLRFVWGHLDHYVDVVSLMTRTLLATLLVQAANRYEKGEVHYVDTFFRDLNRLSTFSKVRVIALIVACQTIPGEYIMRYCTNISHELLTQAAKGAHHELAAVAYRNLLQNHLRQATEEDFTKHWLRGILTMLKQGGTKHPGCFVNMVTECIRQKPSLFRKLFLAATVSGTGIECTIILKCIHYARMNGIEFPLEPDTNPNDYWRNFIIKQKLELFMFHQDDDVRIGALQVIADCQKTTEEFTEWELHYLIRYFQYNVSTSSSRFKSQLVSYYKKIVTRYHSSFANVIKRISNLQNEVDPTDPVGMAELAKEKNYLQEFKCFMVHFVQLLILFLNSDANFYRRAACLEMLTFTQGLSREDEWEGYGLFVEDEVNKLKTLLHDGYECNKAMAAALLSVLPPEQIGFDTEQKTRKYFDECVELATDIRPSQSESACYMFQVLLQARFPFRTHSKGVKAMTNKNQCLMLIALTEKLEQMFEACNEDVTEAAKSTPFYGLLLSCRNLLRNRDIREDNDVYSYIFRKLAELCLNMKSHIMPVVCNSSPEGYIPESSDDCDDSFVESDQSSKAQRILVYSWRTMREIMLLLSEIANQTVTLENVLEMLPEECLLRIGDFFMDVFIETKHRGVFEQANNAFTSICRCFFHSKNENLNSLPVKWIEQALDLCTGKVTDERLCATRRSAGLPFLILSILPILSDKDHELLKECVNPMFAAAEGDNDEFRMHCLNVLRFVFRNGKLSEAMVPHVDRAAITALRGFNSRAWGVRNSATLLLAALVTRIFGAPSKVDDEENDNTNKITLAVFHLRYRNLFNFLFEKLEEECDRVDSLILHPVLLILSKLFPSNNEEVNEKVSKYIPCIDRCITNSSYRTRDLAARASVSLMSESRLLAQLNENFNRIANANITDTECQGLLLQVRHIFQTMIYDQVPITHYLMQSKFLLAQVGQRFSHFTVTLYMDIVYMLLTKYRGYKNLDMLKEMVLLLSTETIGEEITTSRAGYAWSRFQLLAIILMTKFQHVGSTYKILTRIIVNALSSSDLEIKTKCLHFLIYLNQEYSEEQYKEHPLFTSGDIKVCPLTKSLVHSFDSKAKKELLTFTHPYLISFFYGELRTQLKEHGHYFVLIFLLLRFYPCFFSSLRTDRKQNILDWFTTMAKVYDEEIISGVIACLRTFISTLTFDEKKELLYSDMIRLLMESAAPAAADFRRLTVAQFLISTQDLFKDKIFTEYDRYNVVNLVMVLLEDEEALVRNTICDFPSKANKVVTTPIVWKVIPSRARITLLLSCSTEFREDIAICCLSSWALRHLPEVSSGVSEVYERGELNSVAENIPIANVAATVLHAILWKFEDMLNYEDNSIFVEEKTLLVTTLVLNALIKVPSPMMNKETKRTVICVFKCISKFIEDCGIGKDFHRNFKNFFNTQILNFLRASLATDYLSVKAFLTYLYNPILNTHFRFPPSLS